MWWWLSFATGEGSRGVAIVEGDDVADATDNATKRGINPGGEVVGYPFPDALDAVAERERWGTNHLIKPEALIADGYQKRGEVLDAIGDTRNEHGETFEEYEARTGQVICEEHNTKV